LGRIKSGLRDQYAVVETQRFVPACRNDGPLPLPYKSNSLPERQASDRLYW